MATATSYTHESVAGNTGRQITIIEAVPGAARRNWLDRMLQEAAASGVRTFLVSCDFESGGPWGGVSGIFSSVLPEVQAHRPDLLDRHSMELVYVLPRLRRSITVRNPNLTDQAPLEEKTRNYAADRAFRNIQGLIDLLDVFKNTTARETPWMIACDGYDDAATMSGTFFRELMRRRGEKLNIRLVVTTAPGKGEAVRTAVQSFSSAEVIKLDLPGDAPVKMDRALAEQRATELDAKVKGDPIEMQVYLPELIHLWKLAERPDKVLYYRHFGLYLYNTQGLYADALRYGEGLLEMAAEQASGDELRWSIIFKLLMCYMGLQNPHDSMKLAEGEAMKVVEHDHAAWRAQLFYLLGMLYARYQKPRDFAKGEQCLERGLEALAQANMPEGEFHFHSVFNRNGLAMIRNFQGRHQEAIELCRAGLEHLDGHLSVEKHRLHRSVLLYNIAQVYFATGSHEEAIKHYSAAIAMDPNYSEYYNERGNIFLQLGRLEEASADYAKAIDLSPPYFEVFTNLGQCHRRMGSMREAVEAYSRALDLEPNQPLALLGRAKALEELGHAEAAIADYSAALVRDPSLWDAAASRGVLNYEAKRLHDSLADFNLAISITSEQGDLYQNRATVLSDLGMHREAVADLESALRLNQVEEDRLDLQARLETALHEAGRPSPVS
jgi:tetratricopeptide (TPR) repeat protein